MPDLPQLLLAAEMLAAASRCQKELAAGSEESCAHPEYASRHLHCRPASEPLHWEPYLPKAPAAAPSYPSRHQVVQGAQGLPPATLEGFPVPDLPQLQQAPALQAARPAAPASRSAAPRSAEAQRQEGSFKPLNLGKDIFKVVSGWFRPKSGSPPSASSPQQVQTHHRAPTATGRPGEPRVSLAHYVFQRFKGPDGVVRCYRGGEVVLCPEQDIFSAISRRYRQLSAEMLR